jgi:hypothetical protein
VKKAEQQFYNLLKPYLPGDFERVENFASTGMPDVSGAWEGRDYFIELKAQPEKEDGDIEKLLEVSQRVWFRRRCPCGSLIFVVVRFLHRIIISKATAASLVPVAIVKKEKNKWNWDHFQAALKKAIKEH